MSKKKKRLVKVQWSDSRSFGDGGWMSLESALGAAGVEITSVGFVIEQSDQKLILCQSLGTECVGGVILIPASSIVEITDL